jgi:hypothetical protein
VAAGRAGAQWQLPQWPPEQLPQLQPPELDFEPEEASLPPCIAKVESIRLTLVPPQRGQWTCSDWERTSSSKLIAQLGHWYS